MNADLHSAQRVLTEPPRAHFDNNSTAGDDLSQAIQNEPGVVLRVSPSVEDHAALQRICERTRWKTAEAYTFEEALVRVAKEQPDVVLCEANLPDGTWRELLAELSHGQNPPYLIVTSRLADESMWAEVLNLGGYDVLAQPFEPVEIYRVVGFACQRHREQNDHGTKH